MLKFVALSILCIRSDLFCIPTSESPPHYYTKLNFESKLGPWIDLRHWRLELKFWCRFCEKQLYLKQSRAVSETFCAPAIQSCLTPDSGFFSHRIWYWIRIRTIWYFWFIMWDQQNQMSYQIRVMVIVMSLIFRDHLVMSESQGLMLSWASSILIE